MELELTFTQIGCATCGHRFSFGPSSTCPDCGAALDPDEFGGIDPLAEDRRRATARLKAELRKALGSPPVETLSSDEVARSWLGGFLDKCGETFPSLAEGVASGVSKNLDEEPLLELVHQLREIAAEPSMVSLPPRWRLAHSLTKGIAKSLTALLAGLADALEAPDFASATKLKDSLQLPLDRAGILASNFDFALAGVSLMSGASIAEALPGGRFETLEDLTQRATDFARHYYELDLELGPDLAWGLCFTAFNIEGSPEPSRCQKQVTRIKRWLETEDTWELPKDLIEDLRQAAERAAAVEGFIRGMESSSSGLALEEEKARLVGRVSEEILRPLLAILTYFVEQKDDPSRYGRLRRETLASIAVGLEPRLPDGVGFLANAPIDYRHAYAHGGVGNDGNNVVLDLIEPPR